MLSIGAMAAGQDEYYLHLANEDYYLEGGEPPGHWTGRGAESLGLRGEVQAEELRNLFQGFSGDGLKALVQNAGSAVRQPGWDLTFSAPKSVSVVWSQVDETTRQAIQDAHRVAVKAALNYLEESASFSRRGKAGCEREPAGLVVATFEHSTSRAMDPQLHTHCLVMNVATRADGTTGSLTSKPLYEHKMAAGALYRVELANQLEQRLGLSFEQVRSWFEVAGVPKSVMTPFSQRRTAIEEALSARGLETASAAAYATLLTREPKELVPARSELFRQWQELGQSYGFGRAQAERLMNRAFQRDRAQEYSEAYQRALTRITESQSHFAEKDLIRHVAEAAQGRGLDANLITGWARRDLKELVELGSLNGEKRFTTHEMLAVEARLLETAARLQANTTHQIPGATVEQFLSERTMLSDEQRRAVLFVTSNPGSVQVVKGMAGTGKTTMLWVCREIWEKAGYEVVGATVAGKAARKLEEEAGAQSASIAKRLWDLDHPSGPWGQGRFKLTAKTVLVVDEAGMVGTRMMDRLLTAVEEGGSKLVLIGDAGQLQPIEAGGPFRALGMRLGQAELTEIRRQREEWARKAVFEFARGNSRPALEEFAERGLLSVSDNREQAIQKLVEDWKLEGLKDPKDHLILAGTNLDAWRINQLCQAARLEGQAQAGVERVSVGNETLWKGDRVLCTKPSRMFGVENGDTGTVVRANPNGGLLTVQLDRGRTVLLPTEQYPEIRLGYAMTTHKGQGATVEKAYVLFGGCMQDREITYVQASRARGETRLYTDVFEAGEKLQGLVAQTTRSGAKILAHDVPEAVQQVVEPVLRLTITP